MKVFTRRLGLGVGFVREEVDPARFMGVEFDFGDGRVFVIDERDGVLELRAGGDCIALILRPIAANTVRINADPRQPAG